jgi:hypothetical protein
VSRFIRCPSSTCREMISADAGECRFCGFRFTPEQAHAAEHAQATVESALGQAANLKYGGGVALLFLVAEVYFCLFATWVSVYFLVIQVAPAIGLFSGLNWIRKYGALQTDEPDYPEATRAMHRTTWLWAAVFALQFLLLGGLVLRTFLLVKHGR